MIKDNDVYVDLTSDENFLCWQYTDLMLSIHSIGIRKQYAISIYRIFSNLNNGGFIHVNDINDLKTFYSKMNDIDTQIIEKYGAYESGVEKLHILKGIIDKIDKEVNG